MRELPVSAKWRYTQGSFDHSKLSEDELLGEMRAKAGCDRYLRKPFSNAELVTAIQASIDELDGGPRDWQAKAQQYVEGARITTDQIRDLNDKINSNLTSLDERE